MFNCRERQQRWHIKYNLLLSFAFNYPKYMYGSNEKVSTSGRLHTQFWGANLQRVLFLLRSKYSWLYNISNAYPISCGHTCSLLTIRSPWTRLLLACHISKFSRDFCREHVSYLLSVSDIFQVIFVLSVPFPQQHRLMSKDFFKSISNTMAFPVGWGYRIHTMHICRAVRLPQ